MPLLCPAGEATSLCAHPQAVSFASPTLLGHPLPPNRPLWPLQPLPSPSWAWRGGRLVRSQALPRRPAWAWKPAHRHRRPAGSPSPPRTHLEPNLAGVEAILPEGDGQGGDGGLVGQPLAFRSFPGRPFSPASPVGRTAGENASLSRPNSSPSPRSRMTPARHPRSRSIRQDIDTNAENS
jgi:hypothetical protein